MVASGDAATPGIEVQRNTVVAALGLLCVALGAVGPWAGSSVVSVSGYRADDGKAILVVVAIAIGALVLGRADPVSRVVAISLLILAGIAAGNDGVEIASRAATAPVQGSTSFYTDWGPYAIVGGAALAIAALAFRFNLWVRTVLIMLVIAAAAVTFYWIEQPPSWAANGGTILH